MNTAPDDHAPAPAEAQPQFGLHARPSHQLELDGDGPTEPPTAQHPTTGAQRPTILIMPVIQAQVGAASRERRPSIRPPGAGQMVGNTGVEHLDTDGRRGGDDP